MWLADLDMIRKMQRLLELKDVPFSEWSEKDIQTLWTFKTFMDGERRMGRNPFPRIIKRAQAGSMQLVQEIRRLGQLLEEYGRRERRRRRMAETRGREAVSRSHGGRNGSSSGTDVREETEEPLTSRDEAAHGGGAVSTETFPGPGWTGILSNPEDPDAQAYWVSPSGQWYKGTTTSLGEKVQRRARRQDRLNLERLKKRLKLHEGYRREVYRDHIGILTIGIGHNLEGGADRNVRTVGANPDRLRAGEEALSEKQVDDLFELDLRDSMREIRGFVKKFDELPGLAQEVLIEMHFAMGGPRLRGFRKLAAALDTEVPDFNKAADEIIDSRWYRRMKADLGDRRTRVDELAELMRSLADE